MERHPLLDRAEAWAEQQSLINAKQCASSAKPQRFSIAVCSGGTWHGTVDLTVYTVEQAIDAIAYEKDLSGEQDVKIFESYSGDAGPLLEIMSEAIGHVDFSVNRVKDGILLTYNGNVIGGLRNIRDREPGILVRPAYGFIYIGG